MQTILNLLFGEGVNAAFVQLIPLAISLIGAGISAGNSKKINDKRQRDLNEREAESNAYYAKEQYQSELDRTENKQFLAELDRKIKDRNAHATATAAITGATPEAAVAMKGNDANAYANAISRMAALGSARKDRIGQNWEQSKNRFFGAQDALALNRLESQKNLSSNAAALGSSAITAMGSSKGATAGLPSESPIANNSLSELMYGKYDKTGLNSPASTYFK